ncbi:MAG: hypothetical protein AAB496_01625 [Patescibacteria group bacterium]
MKNRKIIAWGMIVSISLAFLNAFGGETDGLYQLSGLGMIVFGIWSSVILLKDE